MTYLPAKIQGFIPTTLEEMQRLANIFVASGLCETSDREERQGITPQKKLAQAVIKIQAGLELGIPPYTAISNFNIIKGKVTAGYQLLLALVRKAKYDFKVHQRDNSGAAIEFFGKEKQSLGISTFDKQDALLAGLVSDNYKKIPRNMYFARAVSNGINAFCPEITKGSIYTNEDFDEVSDDDIPGTIPENVFEKELAATNLDTVDVDFETGEISPKEIEPEDILVTDDELKALIAMYEEKQLEMHDVLQVILQECKNDGLTLTNMKQTFKYKHLAKVKQKLDEMEPKKKA